MCVRIHITHNTYIQSGKEREIIFILSLKSRVYSIISNRDLSYLEPFLGYREVGGHTMYKTRPLVTTVT